MRFFRRKYKGTSISHRQARMDTKTQKFNLLARKLAEIIVRPKGDKKSKLSQLKTGPGNNNNNNINPTTLAKHPIRPRGSSGTPPLATTQRALKGVYFQQYQQ